MAILAGFPSPGEPRPRSATTAAASPSRPLRGARGFPQASDHLGGIVLTPRPFAFTGRLLNSTSPV
jgi:hypothetical protein